MNTYPLNSTVLNILRVYATALVFFCHSTIVARECFQMEWHGLARLLITPAWGGVWMFLAIGGFLAANGFDLHKYSLDKAGILKYYKGRFVKVLVPTWIFISLMYIFNMQNANVRLSTIVQWLTCTFNGHLGYNLGIYGLGASWYVFIVMWLYLISPFLLRFFYKYEKKCHNHELKGYVKLLTVICSLGILFRMGGVVLLHLYDDQLYYNWFYANITGTIDIFAIGVIGERIMHFIPKIKEETLFKYRRYSLCILVASTICFMGLFKYIRTIYFFLGPFMFSLSSISIIIFFSYRGENHNKGLNIRGSKFCNLIAPYTFMFYLWHSAILGFAAEKVVIQSQLLHYIVMLMFGGFISVYIAFLMTKMNNGVIKTLIK